MCCPREGFNGLSPLAAVCWIDGVMKSQTPSTKLQTNLKFQYSITKTKNRFRILKLGTRPQGGESKRSADNFGHCDLFGTCDLLFGIFRESSTPVLQNSSQSLPAKPLNSDPRRAGSWTGPQDQVLWPASTPQILTPHPLGKSCLIKISNYS